ncbi:hypothetical protein Nepgr_028259 [Nepenthes gracilis]|uniref:NADH dehydrogenase subunit 3 n=1 Tax=Nepenthes gracilis TaxID=150966 RepID=A0AAD3Y4C6_NEPGR|nr:hypothetical protein Nepgr_028259 [Nepenthes gracilis]
MLIGLLYLSIAAMEPLLWGGCGCHFTSSLDKGLGGALRLDDDLAIAFSLFWELAGRFSWAFHELDWIVIFSPVAGYLFFGI